MATDIYLVFLYVKVNSMVSEVHFGVLLDL